MIGRCSWARPAHRRPVTIAAWRGSSNRSRTSAKGRRAGRGRPARGRRRARRPASTSSTGPATPATTGACSRWPATPTRSPSALEATVAVAIETIDMERQTGEHPRIGAVDVVPFVPLGDTTMDDCVDARPGVRRPDRRTVRAPGLPLCPAPRRVPTGSSWPTSGAGQYEGLKAEIGSDPDRRAGLRPGADPPDRGGRGRRGAAVPHRLQHQPRLDRRRARQADRPDDPRVRRRSAERPGERLPARGPRLRPGLDEPARLHASRRSGASGRRSRPRPVPRGSSRPSPS